MRFQRSLYGLDRASRYIYTELSLFFVAEGLQLGLSVNAESPICQQGFARALAVASDIAGSQIPKKY
jgi:hypothetical protein